MIYHVKSLVLSVTYQFYHAMYSVLCICIVFAAPGDCLLHFSVETKTENADTAIRFSCRPYFYPINLNSVQVQ